MAETSKTFADNNGRSVGGVAVDCRGIRGLPGGDVVSYPDYQAALLVDQLNAIASANGGNVFLGEIAPDPHNSDYWSVPVDITKQDWHRLQRKLVQAGWQKFGDNDEMIHALPERHFVVARPSF